MTENDHTEELKAAHEIGLSDGEFGGDSTELLNCHCPKCEAAYQRGFDEGLNKLQEQVKP